MYGARPAGNEVHYIEDGVLLVRSPGASQLDPKRLELARTSERETSCSIPERPSLDLPHHLVQRHGPSGGDIRASLGGGGLLLG